MTSQQLTLLLPYYHSEKKTMTVRIKKQILNQDNTLDVVTGPASIITSLQKQDGNILKLQISQRLNLGIVAELKRILKPSK